MLIRQTWYRVCMCAVLNLLGLCLFFSALPTAAQAVAGYQHPAQLESGLSARSPLPKLSLRDAIPKSPPWVYPSDLGDPPACLSHGPGCPFDPNYMTSCSAEKCTATFIGSCVQTDTLINKDCICKNLFSSTCSSQCSGVRDHASYLYWLNATCGDLDDWDGLPKNWTNGLLKPSFLFVGSWDSGEGFWGLDNVYPCFASAECWYSDNYVRPWAVNSTCAGFEASIWEPNLYTAVEAAAFFPDAPGKGYSPSYVSSEPYDPKQDDSIFIDRNGFCKEAYNASHDDCSAAGRTSLLLWASAICHPSGTYGWPVNWRDSLLIYNATLVNSSTLVPPISPGPNHCSGTVNSTIRDCTFSACTVSENNCTGVGNAVDKRCLCQSVGLLDQCNATAIEKTELDLWLNKTCHGIPDFVGLPNNWEDGLMVMNASYQDQQNFSWPSCLNAHSCFDVLSGTQQKCSMSLCDLDPSGGNCSSTTVGFKASCFCRPVTYETTCTENCKLSWEREGYLRWMNSTCSPVAGWDGLPRNWTKLLYVQNDELLPWSWRIQIAPDKSFNTTSTGSDPPQECPSTVSSLVAFAAVNAAMALLVPIFGRRDVMKKLTFRQCGHRGSRMWLLTGPAAVILHVASNVVGAYIIKSTPGYGGVNVGELVLLWCTRPRISWMIIALIPWQAEDAIYFSVASSTLLAEVILQLLGAYYMGVATNYARVQKFYTVGRLQHASRGKDAAVMYAGSIMWLSVMFIAVATCLWSMLGISNYVAVLAFTIRGFNRKAKRSRELANARATKLTSLRTAHDAWTPAVADLEREKQALGDVYPHAIRAFQALARGWQALQTYVTDDTNRLIIASKAIRQNKKKRPSDGADAEEEYADAYYVWIETPSKQLSDLATFGEAAAELYSEAQQHRNALMRQSESTAAENSMLRVRLATTHRKVQTIQSLIRAYQKRRQQLAAVQPSISEQSFVRGRLRDLENRFQKNRQGWRLSHQYQLDHLRQIFDSLTRRISLKAQLRDLRGPGDAFRDQNTLTGLETLIRTGETKSQCERHALEAWRGLCTSWVQIGAEHARLIKIWSGLEKKRRKEDEERQRGNSALLKKIALRSIVGMFGCWAAQWVWWVGYVRASGDDYCPPKLSQIATVWTVFSTIGVMLGGSL
ncbi:hypothetical protein AYL99_06289 [Fonsecaea erecta]|uniref:Uncharacterized protein n=1 Tax=Fonsecaea erecta TaxID=1367422 RepID=A0A178ZH77_9EURO|nr:hypothetical protein AYL99_06289 [Fonsecaea erecta]OAP58992.1 hypothetical protein AYL99_06289 [Fonsecaea erecta]